MSLTVAMIDALVEAGVSAEQLAALVKADLMEREAALTEKRAKDAERQRRHRESRDVTVTDSDNGDPSLSRPPNEKISNPPTHTHPDISSRARKAARLPADWNPGPLSGEIAAAVARWPPKAVERELERFRDWAKSAPDKSGLKLDWQATWRNWLRRVEDEGRYRGKTNGSRFTGNRTLQSIVADIITEDHGDDQGSSGGVPCLVPPGEHE